MFSSITHVCEKKTEEAVIFFFIFQRWSKLLMYLVFTESAGKGVSETESVYLDTNVYLREHPINKSKVANLKSSNW